MPDNAWWEAWTDYFIGAGDAESALRMKWNKLKTED